MKIQFAGDFKGCMVSHEETADTVLFYGKYTSLNEDDEGDDDEWEGTVRRLTRTMERSA